MNWFTQLFSKKSSTDKKAEAQIIQPSPPPTDSSATPENTTPAKVLPQNLSQEQLKKFVPLRDLDESCLTAIQHTTLLYKKGATIFSLGQASDKVFYLLEGQIRMQPDSDSSYEIMAGSTLSNLPLNSGSQCGATAIAIGKVSILEVTIDLNRFWADKSREQASCVELLDIQLPEQISNIRFFKSFAHAYRENKLQLPSLPDVALKLQQAMKQDIGISQAVEILQLDLPIVSKLIQVANSALYSSGTPISNCHEAVARIGLNATRNLVMGISLKQLFNCSDPELLLGMQALWKNSLYVSSLSFVLAQECSNINPDDALLAGLITDIGAIPLLHFAEQFSDEYPSIEELQAALPSLSPPVGALLLNTLGFSQQLTHLPYHAQNWLYDSGPEITIEDIVILAKLHSYFGTGKARDLPYINSIPAYGKLQEGKLNPDFSLNVLNKAQTRINAAMRLLA